MHLLRAVVVFVALPAFAQTYNSNAGGWNTGYGTVYGSFGLAMATQNIYQQSQLNLQRAMARQAMINRWGKDAVEKAEREAAKSGQPTQLGEQPVAPPPPPPKNAGVFKPGRSTVPKQVADALGSTPEEKAAFTELIVATRTAFEAQPETQAWKNNVAGALTFFMISTLTIANNAPEPSDATSQALFQAINQSVDATPELAKASARDKQQLYDALIAFAGLPLALSAAAQESNDAQQQEAARQLAAQLFQLVLKTDPSRISLP